MTTSVPAQATRHVPESFDHGLRLIRAMRRDPLAVLTQVHREHGPFVRIRVPLVPLYLVSDPDAIQEALARTHHEYEKGLPRRRDPAGPGLQPLSRILGQGLLTSPAALHRPQRRLIQPMFHRARIAEYATTFVDLADAATQRWRDGQVRDVHRDMTELTLAIIARTVFDVDLDTDVVAAIRTAVAQNQPALGRSLLPVARLLDRLPLPDNRRWRSARSELDEVVYRLIAQRRSTGLTGRDVLSLLLSARDADTGAPMPDHQVRDEAMTLLLAGHETTANGLAWTLHLLATHPDPQERLRTELDEVLGERLPTLADLPRLGYASAVWRESMRLYPPAWTVIRRLVQEHTVCGYRLAAGSLLLLSPWVVHRDSRWWPEPDEFRPERWLSESAAARPRYSYFPFGGGPRQCIGNDFADLEGILVLATVLRRWRVGPTPGAPPPVPQPLVTLRPRYGVTATLTRGR
jgi:cytochrome P450